VTISDLAWRGGRDLSGVAEVSQTRKHALVAGGLGVIGRNPVQHLASRPDWQVGRRRGGRRSLQSNRARKVIP
jgi:hypothetical protein